MNKTLFGFKLTRSFTIKDGWFTLAGRPDVSKRKKKKPNLRELIGKMNSSV